jgi:23S rRNA pseudouridine2605 synthase
MTEQRLQKILAAAGIDSRRKCEELILEGVVEVNHRFVDKLPAFADPEKDIIKVNGKKIQYKQKVYYLLNKPKGVICTNSDPEGRKKAIDFIPANQRVFCVGRLDTETTGIIILTNDSEMANKLTHPKYGLAKTYTVEMKGEITGEQIEKLKKGIWLSEGKNGKALVKVIKRNYRESVLEISIRQGLNRQVRRLFAAIGFPVKSLKRTKIGKLDDRGLGVGKFRALTPKEVNYLKNIN